MLQHFHLFSHNFEFAQETKWLFSGYVIFTIYEEVSYLEQKTVAERHMPL